jgi:hypothetical protein
LPAEWSKVDIGGEKLVVVLVFALGKLRVLKKLQIEKTEAMVIDELKGLGTK